MDGLDRGLMRRLCGRPLAWLLGVGIGLVLLLVGCARIQPPPGGPPDTQPPTLRLDRLKPGATQVEARPDFVFHFSEYMDRASVRSALSLNPRPEGELELDWRGRRLRVRPSRPLPPDRTWTLELGTAARDLAGNHLPSPLRIPFSTGAKLDTLFLMLEVTPPDGGGRAELWLWPAEERPSRRFTRAPWRSSPDERGRVLFQGLPPGAWFALAVEDLNRDGWWDPDRERAALPSRALAVPDTLAGQPVLFRLGTLAGPDTLSLLGGHFLDRERIQFRAWLEAPALAGWADSLRRGPAADSLRLDLLRLTCESGRQVPLSGLKAAPEGWLLFLAEEADSLPHHLALVDGRDTLQLRPPPAAFRESLIDPGGLGQAWRQGVLTLEARHAVSCRPEGAWQRSGEDSLGVAVHRRSASTLELGPVREGGQLWVERGFLSAGPHVWPDSLLVLPVPAAAPPRASGGVQWSWNRGPRDSSWRLVLRHAEGDRDLPIAYGGSADQLPAGRLLFALYDDRDGSRSWSPGRLDGLPAEPWVVLADTVEVLPGWIQGDIQLHLPEWIP
ncbi:MAG: Ig-like domain-containing protein [bacterium]|jgi:hypothetical protein|nr:Ig-like domain-containing protein [bacterium]